jgi:hypothetical protein
MNNLKRALLGLAVAGLVVAQGPGVSAAPAGPDPGGLDEFAVVTSFDPGTGGAFAESMAPDGEGGMLVSVTTWGPEDMSSPNMGQLWRVRSDGRKSEFGPPIDLSVSGMLTGVEVDAHGRVFVGVYNFWVEYGMTGEEDPPSGIMRVTESSADYVMTLPETSMPNEVTEHAGVLYVTDSTNGYIWRGSASHASTPGDPWYQSDLLSPDAGTMGANGITYGKGALYVSSFDRGLIMRIPVGQGNSSGAATVVAEDQRLRGADGVRFDRWGRLWVAVCGTYDESDPLLWPPTMVTPPEIVVVHANGDVSTVATPDGSLDYPTAVTFGGSGKVLLLNGSYFNGAPNVVALTR